MAAALSQDLRKRLVDEVEQGSSARQAAARFAVSASAAIKLVRRVRETGSTEPGKIGGHRKPLLAGHEDRPRRTDRSTACADRASRADACPSWPNDR